MREIAPVVPADRLLCETDSPYLAPTPHRGKRNEPAWVTRVAEELAALRSVPVEEPPGTDRGEFRRAVSAVNSCTAGRLFVDTPLRNMVRSSGFEER